MSNIGCRIVENITRPPKHLIDAFKDFPVANLGDCMNRLACVNQDIKPINKVKLLGSAFTVKVSQGDNLMFHKAMDMAREGDVIVINSMETTSRAIFGDLMANFCKVRGFAGIIVDGPIRDYASLKKLELPIYAKGISPNGPFKNGPGEINTTISFGGQIVNPGDIVIGDEDGLIIIKAEEALDVLEKVKLLVKKEEEIITTMHRNKTYMRPWVDETLKNIQCEVITK